MLTLKRTNSDDKDFHKLIVFLDLSLNDDNLDNDDEINNTYAKLNVIKKINTVLIAYDDNVPVACGCFRPINNTTAEVKRMFVVPEKRKQGVSSLLLRELEKWIRELNYKEAILETGVNMTPAINLYTKHGFQRIENYGEYIGLHNSYCMKKIMI